MPSAPGIEPKDKGMVYGEGERHYAWEGGSFEFVEELGDTSGPLEEVNYRLFVHAMNEQTARAKARGFATIRHPADSLNITPHVMGTVRDRGGVFPRGGPRETYEVVVEVYT